MKKILILFLILLFPFISAIEVQMNPEFASGETIFLKVSGNFVEPILTENVFFFKDHVQVPFDFELTKIQGEYYLSAMQEKSSGNYSIKIENAKYMAGSEIVEDDIKVLFNITNQTADFSIDKRFINTNQDFFIQVQNLQNSKIILTSSIEEQMQSIELKSGEIKKINYKIKDLTENQIQTLSISSENLNYEIPVYISSEQNPIIQEQKRLRFEPIESNFSASTNSSTRKIIYLHNPSQETIENISIYLSDVLKSKATLSILDLDELKSNSSLKIEIEFLSEEEENLEGQITARTEENIYAYSAIKINFIKGYIPLPEDEIEPEAPGNLIDTDDLIDDEETKISGSTGKIIGWSLVVIILIIVAWFFLKKYKGVKPGLTILDKAKK